MQRIQRRKFRHPCIAELAHIRQRLARVRSEQLFMRRRPGKLLDLQIDFRMLPFESGEQLGGHFAFAPHRPECQVNLFSLLRRTPCGNRGRRC